MDTKGPDPQAIATLTYLGRVVNDRRKIDASIDRMVDLARIQGASWRMIGVALGVSTQAAFQKYRRQDAVSFGQEPLDFDSSSDTSDG